MKTIKTMYLSATDSKGAMVKASCLSGSMVMNYDHKLDLFENHRRIAELLASMVDINFSSLSKKEQEGGYMFYENGLDHISIDDLIFSLNV